MKKNSVKSQFKTSNLVLLVLGLFVLMFIISMEVIFCIMGSVPDILIQYTLGAGGVECLLLAFIKVSKVVVDNKKSKKENDKDEVDS